MNATKLVAILLIAGGALGAIIAPGNSSVLGALLGGVAGSAAGQAIDRRNVRCR